MTYGKVVGVFLVSCLAIGLILFAVENSRTTDAETELPYNNIIQGENAGELQDEQVVLTFVSGTEYSPSDPDGQTIMTVRDYRNNYIDTDCWLTLLYPNKTVYLPEVLMTQNIPYGTYYHYFTVGEVIGNYNQHVKCQIGQRNVTTGKAFHVSNLLDNIEQVVYESEVNLNESLNLLINAFNCTPENKLCERVSNVNNTVNSLISANNDSFSVILDYLVEINASHRNLFYQITAPNCIVGSTWLFQAKVTNEQGSNLPFLDCTLDTPRFGTELLSYDYDTERYQVLHNCTAPSGTVAWDFECVRDY